MIITREEKQIENLLLAMSFVSKFGVAVDVGANVGNWAKVMAENFGKVLAFEPGEDTFAILHRLEDGYSNLHCFDFALGDEETEVLLVNTEKKKNKTQSRYVRKSMVEGEVLANKTSMTTLDSIGLDRLDYIKIDVEGAEAKVLNGAKKTIMKNKPVVSIEVSSYGVRRYGEKPTEAEDLLTSWGAKEVAYQYPDKIFIFGQ